MQNQASQPAASSSMSIKKTTQKYSFNTTKGNIHDAKNEHHVALHHDALKQNKKIEFEENLYVQATVNCQHHAWEHRKVYLTHEYLVLTKIGGGNSGQSAEEVIPLDHLTVGFSENVIHFPHDEKKFPHSYLMVTHHTGGADKQFHGKGQFDHDHETNRNLQRRGRHDTNGNIVYLMHVGLEDVHTTSLSPQQKTILANWNSGKLTTEDLAKPDVHAALVAEEALFALENEKWQRHIQHEVEEHKKSHASTHTPAGNVTHGPVHHHATTEHMM